MINQGSKWDFPRSLKLLLLALLAFPGPACQPDPLADLDRVLTASWHSYRQTFISPEGRVVIPEQDGGTISEAQAYALLRAVWAGDEATFARVQAWTRQHLSRAQGPGDALLAWSWGRRPDGSWGLKDANTAADGDVDYALALVLAARRGWRPPPDLPDYLEEASQVMEAVLENEVVTLAGGEVLLAPGNWHESAPPFLINPSYFSPAAYRLFSQVSRDPGTSSSDAPDSLGDGSKVSGGGPKSPAAVRGEGRGGGKTFEATPVGAVREPPLQNLTLAATLSPRARGNLRDRANWERLHQGAYQFLDRLSQGLGEQPGVGLFPDWCRVDATGRVSDAPGRDTCFGWEAVRLPYRIALDRLWFGEPRAAPLFNRKFLPFFKKEWQAQGRLAAVYNYDGTPAVHYESPVLYAGVLAAALTAGDRDFAGELARKILSFYHEKDGRAYFVSPGNYYANNWAWLGLALYAGWTQDFQPK